MNVCGNDDSEFLAKVEKLKDIIPEKTYMFTKETVDELMRSLSVPSVEELCRLICFGFSLPSTMSPISRFAAGAVAIGISGALYIGFNIEFRGLPLNETVHAEQCAIANALMHKESYLTSIITCPTPCGHCRQFMRECRGALDLQIISVSKPEGKLILNRPLKEILPYSFGPEDLEISESLFDRNSVKFSLLDRILPDTEVFNRAISVAMEYFSLCYSPHSKSWSCVVTIWSKGEGEPLICSPGVYMENAAYNPSLSPLHCSLISLVRRKGSLSDIKSVIVFEGKDRNIKHFPKTKYIISEIAPQSTLYQQYIDICE